MNDFYDFIKNPIWFSNYTKPSLIHFIKFYITYLISIIPIVLIAFLTCKIFSITHKQIEFTFIMKFLIVVLLAPTYEEIFFRSLLKFNRLNVILFIVNLVGFILWTIIKEASVYFIFSSAFLLMIIILITLYPIETISKYVVKNIKLFFYLTSILFGVFHAINFTGNPWIILSFSFILGGPQIVAGLILGYIRLRFGLVYSILFHMLINSSILLTP